ncbi:MAG TPA: hypothetical protein VJ777_19280 [Mycobacterium sp.]|nr:hypothetical protein [Mycobacterium sp.]
MQPETIVELPDNLRDPMRRKVNKDLMVAWINADLLNRASHDVRTSLVFYDDAGVFVAAAAPGIAVLSNFGEILRKLYEQTTVRYYTKGI